MKYLSRLGLITKKEKAQPFTMNEEEAMWKSTVLGQDNPEQLLNILMYLLGVHLCLHAVDEHKSLKVGYYLQIKVKFDEDRDCKFFEFVKTCSKNHQRGTKDFNVKLKRVTVYKNKENPTRYVVAIYQKYLSVCPSHDPKCSHDLYLRPLKRYTEHVWYSYQPLGINTLQQVISKLANHANLSGKCTNHNLRAMGPIRFYEKGLDNKLVRELSGYRSNAILEYKHTSGQLKHHVSQVLYGNKQSHIPQVKSQSQKSVHNANGSPMISSQNFTPSEVLPPSSQTSQGSSTVTVNYSIPENAGIPVINVYPIINILQGLNPGTPVIINVNLQMQK